MHYYSIILYPDLSFFYLDNLYIMLLVIEKFAPFVFYDYYHISCMVILISHYLVQFLDLIFVIGEGISRCFSTINPLCHTSSQILKLLIYNIHWNPATTPIFVTGQNWHCSEISTVVGF